MKLTVLGAGRWASTLALHLARKNYNLKIWERKFTEEETNPLFTEKKNKFVDLSCFDKVSLTHDLEEAMNYSDIFVMSILSQQVDNFMQEIKNVEGYENKKYVLAMKGIEATTGRRLSEVLIDNGVKRDNIAVWVGPAQPALVVDKQPTNMVVSAYNPELARELVSIFETPELIDFVISEDIIGTEIGAAAKNVIGIAGGILDGQGYKQKKGALLTASMKEIGTFMQAMGGEKESAIGLSFAGDFDATLYYEKGNNLSYGRLIIEHQTTDENILNEFIMPKSVEGIMTSKALILLQDKYNEKVTDDMQLKMPITHAVHEICSGQVPMSEAGLYMSKQITEALKIK